MILDLLVATGSPAGVRDQFEALVTSWVEIFNARLADKVAGNKHTLVDFYTAIEDQIANPVKVRFDQCCYTCLLSCSWRRLCWPCLLTTWKLVQPMHCLSTLNPPTGETRNPATGCKLIFGQKIYIQHLLVIVMSQFVA